MSKERVWVIAMLATHPYDHAGTWLCSDAHARLGLTDAHVRLDLVSALKSAVLEMRATRLCMARRLTHPRSILSVSQVGIYFANSHFVNNLH